MCLKIFTKELTIRLWDCCELQDHRDRERDPQTYLTLEGPSSPRLDQEMFTDIANITLEVVLAPYIPFLRTGGRIELHYGVRWLTLLLRGGRVHDHSPPSKIVC